MPTSGWVCTRRRLFVVFVELGAVPLTAAVVGVPAQDPAPPPQGPEFGKSSPVVSS